MKRWLSVPLLMLGLAGCASPELQTTPVDVERAFSAASDPWAAPEGVVFPSQQYGGANLLRDAGERVSEYPGLGTKQIARLEIQAAQKNGWTLASVECNDDPGDDPTFIAALNKGDDLDSYALATLTADGSEATVSVEVPHHLDGSWPSTRPVALTDTCLGGGSLDEAPTPLPFDAYPGKGQPSLVDYEPWQRDSLDDTETDLVARTSTDPFLTEIGAEAYQPELHTGDNWRSALSTGAEVTSTQDSTRASVADVLERSGWTTTWVSCGEGLPTVATARLPVDDATIVARLISTEPGTVEVDVTIGVPEAPLTWPQIDEVSALTDSRCLTEGDVGPGLLVEGTPVATPAYIHPYLRSTSD